MAADQPYQLLPPLSEEEYAALRADVAVHGIRVPVDIDENGQILDGHHRAAIADELGIDYPTRVVTGLSEDEKRHHALAVNTVRRKLSREERHALIRAELTRDPLRSDRAIGRWLGVDGKTVGAVRHELDDEKRALQHAQERAHAEALAYVRARVDHAPYEEKPAWVAWAYAHQPDLTERIIAGGIRLGDVAAQIYEQTGCDLGCAHPRHDLTHAEFPHSELEELLAEPDYKPYTPHPFVDMIPLVPVDEFAGICASIGHDGLLHPITLNHDETVLVDGRIRYLACRETGVEPRFKLLGPDYDEAKTIAYILSMNVKRKHLPRLQRLILEASGRGRRG